MADETRTGPKLLSLRVGVQATLDLVWEGDTCWVVFNKRGAFRERVSAPLRNGQHMEAARFLAGVEALPAPLEDESDEQDPK